MKRKLIVFFSIIILGLFVTLKGESADEGRFAVNVKAGTLGGGLEGIIKLTDKIDAKIGGNYFKYDFDNDITDVEYNLDAELMTYSALLDWYPTGHGFRFSIGALYNDNEIELEGRDSSYTFNGTTYTAAEVGNLNGNVDWDKVAPYFGIGWGRPFGKDKRWTFTFDIGAMYHGNSDVSLTSSGGTLSSNQGLQSDLSQEREDVKDKINDFPVYPVVSIGFSFRF